MTELNKNQNGFSLIEVIISIAIILILLMGVYSLIILSIKINNDNKSYVVAMEIANQKMEEIRNLPYDDVGTIGGSPSGTIPEYLSIQRNGEFSIHTTVMFYDDPFDGTIASGTDSIFTDYKIATVEVNWNASFGGNKNVTVFSKIIPNTEETDAGYGLLKLSIVNSNGAAVSGATIHIENSSPFVNADYVSDSNGKLSLPLPPDTEGYEITVTKTGYSTDGTHTRDAENPNPTKPHLSIFAGVKTEESFAIDTLGVFTIHTVSNTLPNNWRVDSTGTSSDDYYPRIKFDGANNLYFTWQNINATSSKILAQKYNYPALTKQWSQDTGIAETTFQKHPDLAVSSAGNSYIVWQDNSTVLKLLAKNKSAEHRIAKLQNYKPRLALNFNYKNTPQNFLQTVQKNALIYPQLNIFSKAFSYLKANFLAKKAYALGNTIIFVGMDSGAATGISGNIVLQRPPNVIDGDFLLAFIHHDDHSDGPILPPAGWNILDDDIDPSGWYSDSRGGIFWKIANSEPASYTFTLSINSEQKAGHIRAYRYVDATNPFDGVLNISTTGVWNSVHSAPSHNVSNDGSMLVCGWGADTTTLGDNNPSFPAGMLHPINNFANGITAASADMSVDISDSPTSVKLFNAFQTVTRASADWSLVLKPAPSLDYITVSGKATQTPFMLIPSYENYLGGTFVIEENNTGRNITSIKFSESGTIDAQNEILQAKLFYDEDISAPYDCESEQYDPGIDPQFGSTEVFDSSNGSTTFSSALGLAVSNTKSVCFYLVLDIATTTSKDETLKIIINNPNTDITVDSGSVEPNTTVALNGTTNLLLPANIDQIHYRWRYDNGSESSATWKEFEDTPTTITKNTKLRLRFELTNNGSFSSSPRQFILEYGKLISSCDAISTWTTVPTDNTQHWQIVDSTNLNDGATTSNVLSGLSDENSNFLPGEVKDSGNLCSANIFSASDFSEYEFNLIATNNALDATYCFRLTNNGDISSTTFSSYPKVSIVGDYNIFIRSLDSSGAPRWDIKKVNITSLDQNQINPRLAISDDGTIATSVVVWEDYRNGNYDIYAQSFDDSGNRLWPADLALSSSSTDEHSPAIAIDDFNNFYVAWVNNESSKNIYLSKYRLNGLAIWSEPKILIATSADAYDPSLSVKNNYLYLSWTGEENGVKNVYIGKFSTTTVTNIWKKFANLENHTDDQFSSSITVDSTWEYVSWTDNRFANNDIFVQKFDNNGNIQWSKDYQLNINLDNTSQIHSSVIINNSGDTLATWMDDRNGNFDIYATKFSDPSSLSGIANVPLIVTGTKQIGESPVIYKFAQEFTTDSNGYVSIPIEWDVPGYKVEIKSASSSLNIVFRDPIQPLQFLAGETKNMDVYVQ